MPTSESTIDAENISAAFTPIVRTWSASTRPDGRIESPLRCVPVPTPRPLMRQRMHEVADLIGGPVETLFVGRDQDATRALYLQMTGLIVMGTACSRPLLQEEGRCVSQITRQAVLIARLENDAAFLAGLTFDYLESPDAEWIQRGLMWQDTTCHGLWLVPSVGVGRSVRLSAFSRELVTQAPFYCTEERTAGLIRAVNSLRPVGEVC